MVTTDSQLLERLESGTKKRRVGSTTTNSFSSRSHSVFSISCDGVTLHLLDLAGNERAGSRCYGPNRFREGANINKSLVALGTVISALGELYSVLLQKDIDIAILLSTLNIGENRKISNIQSKI